MFEKEANEYAKEVTKKYVFMEHGRASALGFLKGAEFGYNNNKANEELEEKISVLLSCKNCPENKDGLICQKEYENKCLAQKIQYIKELKEENAELKENFRICEKNADTYFDNLTEAKEIIKNIIQVTWGEGWNYSLDWKIKAEQFLKELSK